MNEVFGQGLSHKISVYVPSTQNVNLNLSEDAHKNILDTTIRFLSELYGGATAVTARGAYVTTDGLMVIEMVTVVTAYTDNSDLAKQRKVKMFCEFIRRSLGQEAIAVEVDGEMYFV